jgi:hypothetical protein
VEVGDAPEQLAECRARVEQLERNTRDALRLHADTVVERDTLLEEVRGEPLVPYPYYP